MDISSLLPLLMQKNGNGNGNGNGGKPDLTAMVQSMMNQNEKTGEGEKRGLDPASLLPLLQNRAGGSPISPEMLSLLSTVTKDRTQTKKPRGLKPVKPFVADDILGKMVKYFG